MNIIKKWCLAPFLLMLLLPACHHAPSKKTSRSEQQNTSGQNEAIATAQKPQQGGQEQMKDTTLTRLIALGRKIYNTKTCNTCHSIDGSKGIGPTWKGLYGAKVVLQNGKTVTADDAYISRSITDPNVEITEGFLPVMPDFSGQLSARDIRGVIEYIKTLK